MCIPAVPQYFIVDRDGAGPAAQASLFGLLQAQKSYDVCLQQEQKMLFPLFMGQLDG